MSSAMTAAALRATVSSSAYTSIFTRRTPVQVGCRPPMAVAPTCGSPDCCPFPSARRFLQVAAEFVTHGREQLVAEGCLAARAEPLVERGRKHGHRDGRVDRGFDRPAAFPGVGDPAGAVRQGGILG